MESTLNIKAALIKQIEKEAEKNKIDLETRLNTREKESSRNEEALK